MSKKEKPAKKKKGLKVLAVILAVIIVFVGVTTILTVIGNKSNLNKAKSFPAADCPLECKNVSNGVWDIVSDKELKIVQLTDVHLGGGWMSTKKDSMSLNAVAAMLSKEKPDLVIATGDIAYPVPFQAGTFNNKSGAKLFAELMETLGIYWVVSFGNHDTEAYSYYTREEITDFYTSGSYPHCLLQAGPEDVDGCGNQIFRIVNSQGIITRGLFIMDSHSYIDGDIFGIMWKYDNIHENQVSWYKDTVKAMNDENAAKGVTGKTVPTSIFMHIPLTEYKDAWNEYLDNGRKDTENVKFRYGTTGEKGNGIYCGIHEDDLFETMLELGSTDSVFCGHDHLNNFSVNYKGIDLTYGMSVDYLAYPGIYKKGSQRGCTVLTIGTDGSIKWEPKNYYTDDYVSYYEKEQVEMQNLDEHK